MSFFEDYLDDIKRGDTEAENLPPEIARTCAILLSEYTNPEVIDPAMPNTAVEQTGLNTMTSEELAEHFANDPPVEDRDMTEEELENLLKGFEEDDVTGKYDIVIRSGKKIKVPKKGYVQNEEQTESTRWNKIKELDLPEPEKNELDLPVLKNTAESDIPEIADSIDVAEKLPADKIAKHKNKMLSDEEYRGKIEVRINNLITKIELGEVDLKDLTPEDQQVIIELLKK